MFKYEVIIPIQSLIMVICLNHTFLTLPVILNKKMQEDMKNQDYKVPSRKVIRSANSEEELIKLENDHSQSERITWGQSLNGLLDVWRQTQGRDIKVAVLDTGIDTDHPDLKDAIIETKDFSGDGIEDVDGHGTHTAGTVAARINGAGLVGVAPESQLLIGKVFTNNGDGNYDMLVNAIRWATDAGADIISMSLGGPATTPDLFQAIHYALINDRIVICAAGNEGSFYQNNIGYPGRYGGVITIGAHDRNGNATGFSSRGGEIDFMAPGKEVWSTWLDGGYAKLDGTSMATPFVAGLAALILSKHRNSNNQTPIDNNEDMRNHLMRLAAHPGYFDAERGYGPINAFYL